MSNSKTNPRLQLLASAPIAKALFSLGIPTMFGMLINAVYNVADAYFVSGLGQSQLGAITIVYPLSQVMVGLGLLFGNGAAAYISRQLGCGNQAKASQIASTALYSCLLSGAVIITLALLFLQPLLQLSGASVSILPYAKTYAPIYIIACIFNLFNVTMNNIVTSEGAARTTWRALLSGALLNIILDPLLIYSLNWGVAGAAVATAISQLFSSLIYLHYILSRRSVFSFKPKDCRFAKEILLPIMQIGIPTMIFQLLGSLAITLINRQAQFYGDYAVAALGTVTRLLTIGSLMVFGFIKGFQPLAAYSYGAQNYNRLRNAIYTTTRWATFLCIAFSLIMLIFASQIIAQFSGANQQLQTLGIQALRINAISFLFFGFHTVYSCLFLALGQARTGFILGICRQGLCFLPLVWFLSRFYGLHGLIYAQPAADILTAFITLILAIHLHKKLPK